MIASFENEYSFLSNFFKIDVTYNGITFKNNEAAFQAQKCPSRINEFINLSPNKAKRLGRKVELRSDWDQVKDQIMYEICKCKFTQHPILKFMLINTYGHTLIEGNWWNDTYWGVCKGVGQNKLGKILMRIREELSNELYNSSPDR